MIPKRIEGATRYLGAPKGWEPDRDGACGHLAILDAQLPGGTPVMISAWEPTPAEVAAIQSGAPVYLQVVGAGHPPVALWVESPTLPAAANESLRAAPSSPASGPSPRRSDLADPTGGSQ